MSTATVSHVINKTRFVHQDLKERVVAAMKDLDYRPNGMARNLRRAETKTIGVILIDDTNPFFAETVRGIKDAGYRHGYTVVVCNSDDNPLIERHYVEKLAEMRIDGAIIFHVRDDDVSCNPFAPFRIPVASIASVGRVPPTDAILIDHRQGARQAVEHLLSLGHRRIACITGPADSIFTLDRLEGYREALSVAGLSYDPRIVFTGDHHPESGAWAAESIMLLSDRPTAIFAFNDFMAYGAITVLAGCGILVPGNMSVVGFDDINISSFFNPPLTAVAQPRREMGEKVFELLLERIRDRDEPLRRVVLPTRLMVRNSTARVVPGG